MIGRNISASLADSPRSILLLGPRQVGKSTLMRSLEPDYVINLVDEEVFYRFASNPGALRSEVDAARPSTVFVDEIQRLPSLLNTIQALLDESNSQNRRAKSLKFYLTGSSARKLKRGGANLLPGRVLHFQLGPLVASELGYRADSRRLLRLGALPAPYLEKREAAAQKLLRSYVASYVREEIMAEALVRNLDAFTRFSQVAMEESGNFVDYSKQAQRAKVSRQSLSRFYDIFEDTLVGHRLWPFAPLVGSHRKTDLDLVKHPKFFVFDVGVYNAMVGNFEASSDRVGRLAEHLIHQQILHSAWSKDIEVRLSTFRTRGGVEVDFVVELARSVFAVEVKTSDNLREQDVRHLLAFRQAVPASRESFVFHLGKRRSKVSGVWCLPWQEGLKALGL